MNIYIVLEGESGARKLYKSWIPLVNPNLCYVDYMTQIRDNNFFILAGLGQPHFLERVEKAVEDVNNIEPFNRLVIAVDSENSELRDKQIEVSKRVDRIGCRVEVRYVIQHFCVETWLLGNRHMFRKKPNEKELIEYMRIFNVRNNDPALLPPHPTKALNRAQFAYEYLRAGIGEVHNHQGLLYSKKNPGVVAKEGYFTQVKSRCLDEKHISSFQCFLDAFI